MSTEQQNNVLSQFGFRHTQEVKALIEDIATSENSNLTTVMRQIFNDGLKARHGTVILGNKIIERGNVPVLEKVSQAS